jgi:hypothetical protein
MRKITWLVLLACLAASAFASIPMVPKSSVTAEAENSQNRPLGNGKRRQDLPGESKRLLIYACMKIVKTIRWETASDDKTSRVRAIVC